MARHSAARAEVAMFLAQRYALDMYTTEHRQRTTASRAAVYRACLDPVAVAQWLVPDGMTSHVHAFDPREGGTFRISLTYEGDGIGKSGARTDTFHGRFVKLVPDELIIEKLEFETADPAMRGEMTVTIALADAGDGTEISYTHEGVPDAVPPADNEAGTRMSLAKLAAIAER
jgi:uncharacterized protein YndB with AHSA1/START domain